jgi:hypothetical protein
MKVCESPRRVRQCFVLLTLLGLVLTPRISDGLRAGAVWYSFLERPDPKFRNIPGYWAIWLFGAQREYYLEVAARCCSADQEVASDAYFRLAIGTDAEHVPSQVRQVLRGIAENDSRRARIINGGLEPWYIRYGESAAVQEPNVLLNID